MTTTLAKIRLINRAFIKPESVIEVFSLCKSLGIGVVLGSDGFFQSGPYIQSLYFTKATDKSVLSISDFQNFLISLSEYLDMYHGYNIYSYAEFCVEYTFKKDDTIKSNTSQLALYFDEKTTVSVVPKTEPILSLKPEQQKRITSEDMGTSTINTILLPQS